MLSDMLEEYEKSNEALLNTAKQIRARVKAIFDNVTIETVTISDYTVIVNLYPVDQYQDKKKNNEVVTLSQLKRFKEEMGADELIIKYEPTAYWKIYTVFNKDLEGMGKSE